MPPKMPIKSTDRRRQQSPPPIKNTLKARGAQGTLAGMGANAYKLAAPGGTPYNDRRDPPPAGQPSYVRQGPKSPSGSAARSYS